MAKITAIFSLITLFFGMGLATIRRVPEQFPIPEDRIQQAIDASTHGDTVSIRSDPPYAETTNISFKGKNILVTNRGYIDPSQPRDSTKVVIVADNANPPHPDTQSVVRFVSGETQDAILQGVTIRGGRGVRTPSGIRWLPTEPSMYPAWWSGGGIYILGASPTIEHCIIRKNILPEPNETLYTAGGGMDIIGPLQGTLSFVKVLDCLIDSNSAGDFGGGINQLDGMSQIENSWLLHNRITGIHGLGVGGGGGYFHWLVNICRLYGDSIADNICEGGSVGGGVYTLEPIVFAMNRTRIVNNSSDASGGGIFIKPFPGQGSRIVFGYSGDYGYNVFMNNHAGGQVNDIYLAKPLFGPYLLYAEGNYWGSIHTDTIISHIMAEEPEAKIDFDMVAASNKWFRVTYNSSCRTNALITGDLTVYPNVVLSIERGDTFYFWGGDDTQSGIDATLTELIINGSIDASGISTDTIRFTYFPFGDPGVLPYWYGIRITQGGRGEFSYCEVESAYIGLSAESACASLRIVNSWIKDNVLAGIYSENASPVIRMSKITDNGVYGIYLSASATEPINPNIVSDSIINNQEYGIYWDAPISHNAQIIRNTIRGSPNGLYGIYLTQPQGSINEILKLINNQVDSCAQTGLHFQNLSDALVDSMGKIMFNHYYGIHCVDNSSPRVRRTGIDFNGFWESQIPTGGVFAEGNSFPDLGTESDHGMNKIQLGNPICVANLNPEPQEPIYAQYNWWGDTIRDTIQRRIAGLVIFEPWLTSPPWFEGGGGQSAGIIKPIPTFALYQPKPNPANGAVKITYALPNRCKAEFTIYDVLGRTITNITEEKDVGFYEYLWNGKDQRGKNVSNGIYIVRLKAGDNLKTQRVVIAR